MGDSGTRAVSFGIKTSQAGIEYADILRIWQEADAMPEFEHAWLWDHLVPLRGDVTGPALEAWTLLSALAAQTSRLRLGVIVTSNRIRPPAVLAKMAATTDIIADGRLIFGIGAGGSVPKDGGTHPDSSYVGLVRRELAAYGIDVVSSGTALAALGEACTLIRRLWADDKPFDFDGRYYQLKDAICEPKPVQRPGPPVLIGSGGERTGLRLVAEHADLWVGSGMDAATFRRQSSVLDGHCAAIGRDPKEIGRLTQVMFTAEEPADPSAARFPGPSGARDLITELMAAGATHIVLASPGGQSLRWVADEIIHPVLGH
ncbi:MAG TPA: LLM class flavin-dependent oxidoreductase [Trebonia sp.]|jgi:alkanesulfonate monooxygenase SsuD/methylene tetrahydromethanopterin reductase-like flavin-dependent oxidoreductase (luciferase family)